MGTSKNCTAAFPALQSPAWLSCVLHTPSHLLQSMGKSPQNDSPPKGCFGHELAVRPQKLFEESHKGLHLMVFSPTSCSKQSSPRPSQLAQGLVLSVWSIPKDGDPITSPVAVLEQYHSCGKEFIFFFCISNLNFLCRNLCPLLPVLCLWTCEKSLPLFSITAFGSGWQQLGSPLAFFSPA